MQHSLELVLGIDGVDLPGAWERAAAAALGVAVERITAVRPRKRSVNARHRPRVRLQADVWVDEPAPPEVPPAAAYRTVPPGRSVIVVGCGPTGMFAALRLIELGIKPIVLERGKDVQARRRDLAAITRQGVVDPDSNYCFGEGGAGTYSDGKLYTRATRRGNVEGVLRTLVAHGAPSDILIEAHPHIGSNRLPPVVKSIRDSIVQAGGEVRFNTRVEGLVQQGGRLVGVHTAAGDEVTADAVILATGHSARDIFELLARESVLLEAKAFAMGLRIEHPQPLIDKIQYKRAERHPALEAASYRLAHEGVFSFCMCPGGWIVPAATSPGEVVVNGMSLSRRDSPFANSGLVVTIEAAATPLAGVASQHALEVMAFEAGGGAQRAPGQRVTDFLAGRLSDSLPASSYHPGLTSAPLHELLPADLSRRLQEGLRAFGRSMQGYITEAAVLVGVETRTSSPVRIPRDPSTLEHPGLPGLFPCGEGAGFAGGIVSAALDGIAAADACAGLSPKRNVGRGGLSSAGDKME